MNDDLFTQLKILVEQTVRPVQATLSRKHQMREELLAHLLAIYEEELEAQRNERAAFERVTQRFGNPADLSREMQDSVSRWNRRIGGWQQHKLRFESGESCLHFATKQIVLMIALTVVFYLIAAPIGILFRAAAHKPFELAIIFRVVLATIVVSTSFTFTLLFLGAVACRALGGADRIRRRRTAILCCLASLFALPVMVIFLYGCLWLGLPTSTLLLACSIAPAMPVLIFLVGHTMAEELRRDEEWSQLQIEE